MKNMRKTNTKKTTEKLVNAIESGDNVNAFKLLEKAMKARVEDQIKSVKRKCK